MAYRHDELADLYACRIPDGKGVEAAALDGGVVDEDVGGAVVRSDEAEALFGVEPLHSTLCHVYNLIS